MNLKENVYYWFKGLKDSQWKVCIVKEGYIYTLEYEPFKINHLNFNYYEFREIDLPK